MQDFFNTNGQLLGLMALALIAGWFIRITFDWLKESSPWKKFIYRLTTAEQYWRSTAIFIILSVFMAGFTIVYSSTGNVVGNLSFLIETLTLFFGIYAGYFAFKQMNLGRYESIISSAKQLFVNGGDFKRAIKEYELASSIKLNFLTGAEQTECYACLSDWVKYDRMIDRLPHVQVDDRDELILFYLKSIGPLLREEIARLREVFRQTISFKKTIKKSINASWSTAEIKKSDAYERLSPETKTIMDNYLKYINNQLSDPEKQIFEETYG